MWPDTIVDEELWNAVQAKLSANIQMGEICGEAEWRGTRTA